MLGGDMSPCKYQQNWVEFVILICNVRGTRFPSLKHDEKRANTGLAEQDNVALQFSIQLNVSYYAIKVMGHDQAWLMGY